MLGLFLYPGQLMTGQRMKWSDKHQPALVLSPPLLGGPATDEQGGQALCGEAKIECVILCGQGTVTSASALFWRPLIATLFGEFLPNIVRSEL